MDKISNILHFLSELKQNNNREWFNDNKPWYEQIKNDFLQLGDELIVEIAKFDEDIKNLNVKECVFRIYRDTRFSHDKTPYKTHMGVYIAAGGGRKSQRGGYYLHLEPDNSFVSVGVWCPDPAVLKALRQSVHDNIDELEDIINQPDFSAYFANFYEQDKLKTVPRGFPKDAPHAELLKLKHFLVDHHLSRKELERKDFVSYITGLMKNGYPLNRFLNYTVDEVLNESSY